MKSNIYKIIIVLCCVLLVIVILNKSYAITDKTHDISITIDSEGIATMVTKNTNKYLINPYKGFSVDDNPVLKEGNILTSKIGYDEYWNNRNGSLATEGYARFNWYQFYNNTFKKPNDTRNYHDIAYNWDVLKAFIIVCVKNGIDARFGVMTANTTGTDSAYGKTDAYSMSKLQEHIMPVGSIMPDGIIVEEGQTVYKARNATPMWMFEGIPVGYNDSTKEYIYDTNNDVEYYLDNKELQWIPKWDDKNLIKNINDFVYSLSEYLKNEEYNGKKLIDYVSFVEVRSYGNYGENHLTGINDNAKFICGDLDLTKYPTYSYVEPTSCYVTNSKGETYNVYESTLFNDKTRYSINVSAEYYYDNYLITYLDAFRDTKVKIVMNWAAIWDSIYNSTDGYVPNGRLRKWIKDNNGYLTVRADSIFLNYFGDATQLYVSNGVAPSSFEYVFNTYKKNHENDNDAIKNNITNDLIKVIQNGRVTYMDLSDDLYSYYVNNFDDYETEIAKFGNTLGYYFRLKQAKYNTNIVMNEDNNLNVNLFFVNEGVSRLYDKDDSKVYIALLEIDNDGNVLYDEFGRTNVVSKYLTDINPTEWNSILSSLEELRDPSDSNNWINENINVTIDDVSDGNYMLAVGLFTDYDDTKPTIKLGNTGSTLDNWYTLGNVEVEQYSSVKSHYYLENSTISIADSREEILKVGSSYNVTNPEFEGYTYVSSSDNVSGIVDNDGEDIYFYYKKNVNTSLEDEQKEDNSDKENNDDKGKNNVTTNNNIDDRATLEINNIDNKDKLVAHKVIDYRYDDENKTIISEFTDNFKKFIDSTDKYKNIVVDDYIKLINKNVEDGIVNSTSDLNYLFNNYSLYIRENNIVGYNLIIKDNKTNISLEPGVYFIISLESNNVYDNMIINIDYKINKDKYILNDRTLIAKKNTNKLEKNKSTISNKDYSLENYLDFKLDNNSFNNILEYSYIVKTMVPFSKDKETINFIDTIDEKEEFLGIDRIKLLYGDEILSTNKNGEIEYNDKVIATINLLDTDININLNLEYYKSSYLVFSYDVKLNNQSIVEDNKNNLNSIEKTDSEGRNNIIYSVLIISGIILFSIFLYLYYSKNKKKK